MRRKKRGDEKTMAQEHLWETFPELVKKVREDHKAQALVSPGGHNFEHAFAVAQCAQMIAEDERMRTLGWIAGMCHNTDRIFPGSTDEDIVSKTKEYLGLTDLNEDEKKLIIQAVLEHTKKNSPNDNPVTIILKDADRLDNTGALVCLRSAQLFHHLPPVDYVHLFSNPKATFKNPLSAATDIYHCLEWESWLRMPKAKIIGAPKFAFLKSFLAEIERELKEVGLYPYPFGPEEQLFHYSDP